MWVGRSSILWPDWEGKRERPVENYVDSIHRQNRRYESGCDLKSSGQFNIRRAFLFLSRSSCNKIAHGNRMAWMVLEFRHAKGSVMGNAEMDIVIEKCRPANSKFRTSDKRQLAPVLLV